MAKTKNNSGMSEDTKVILVVLLLIFVYPAGLVLMFMWMKNWPTWLKILITLPLILWLIIFFGIISTFMALGLNQSYNVPSLDPTPYPLIIPSPISQ